MYVGRSEIDCRSNPKPRGRLLLWLLQRRSSVSCDALEATVTTMSSLTMVAVMGRAKANLKMGYQRVA